MARSFNPARMFLGFIIFITGGILIVVSLGLIVGATGVFLEVSGIGFIALEIVDYFDEKLSRKSDSIFELERRVDELEGQRKVVQ